MRPHEDWAVAHSGTGDAQFEDPGAQFETVHPSLSRLHQSRPWELWPGAHASGIEIHP